MPGRIVVGVDGSVGASTALRWAYEEAQLRDMAIDIVHAWHYPAMVGISGMAAAGAYTSREELEKVASVVLEHAVEKAGPPPSGVRVERSVAEGGAATVLLARAAPADLLVVGSRGHGGFSGLLLGSVSQQCAHHAPCPVVIVPTPATLG